MNFAIFSQRVVAVCAITAYPAFTSETFAAIDAESEMRRLDDRDVQPMGRMRLSNTIYLGRQAHGPRQSNQPVLVSSISESFPNPLNATERFVRKLESSLGITRKRYNPAPRRARARNMESFASVIPSIHLVPTPQQRPDQRNLLTDVSSPETGLKLNVPHAIAPNNAPPALSQTTTRSTYTGSLLVVAVLLLGAVGFRWRREKQRLSGLIAKQSIYNDISVLPSSGEARQAAIDKITERLEQALSLGSASFTLVRRDNSQICNLRAENFEFEAPSDEIKALVAVIRDFDSQPGTLWHCLHDGQDIRWVMGDEVSTKKQNAIGCFAAVDESLGLLFTAHTTAVARIAFDPRTPSLITQLMASTLRATNMQTGNEAASGSTKAQKLKTDYALAGRMAHEFNNVLTSITGYAEMAADCLKPGSSPHNYVENIQAIGQRAHQIVDHMLDKSRLQQKPMTSFDVVAATRDIVSEIRILMPQSTKLKLQFPRRALSIRGNPVELQQAVTNLCKNAGEAMTRAGSVTLGISMMETQTYQTMRRGATKPGRYVRISVEDTGSGIASATLHRIFDPYFTTRAAVGGTGLGLPMVCDFIESLQGGIDVKSETGQGTKFDLYLPLAEPVIMLQPQVTQEKKPRNAEMELTSPA